MDTLPAAPPAAYAVLARKYRPRRFEDLVGQDAMVRTLTNAFKTGRIAHAFMMTGVRGVGKTTTARLLARALNYKTDTVDQPSITLDPLGVHCQAIMDGTHLDVLEMDAASRTGINDIREILDGVRFAPTLARKKVYIIDEVHMLSTAAFNGLLKTLEEPPPHVVFIFATTEIRKVPVTVLSRCQRFDLKRVDADVLAAHLTRICGVEKVAVDPDGVALIAKAAEGSVRDALSLLDQALVQNGGGAAVTATQVRDMLGLADRGRLVDLLTLTLNGDVAGALSSLQSQYDAGADPILLLRDLLDLAHEASRLKALGAAAKAHHGAEVHARLQKLAEAQSLASLARLWQLLLRSHEDAQKAPDALAAAEMALIRVAAAAQMPPPEDAARLIAALQHLGMETTGKTAPTGKQGRDGASAEAAEPAPTPATAQPLPVWKLFARLEEHREVDLHYDAEHYLLVAEAYEGHLVYDLAPGAPSDLISRLRRTLEAIDEAPWTFTRKAAPQGALTLAEERANALAQRRQEIQESDTVKAALMLFPDASVTQIRPAPPGRPDLPIDVLLNDAPVESDDDSVDNVISVNFLNTRR